MGADRGGVERAGHQRLPHRLLGQLREWEDRPVAAKLAAAVHVIIRDAMDGARGHHLRQQRVPQQSIVRVAVPLVDDLHARHMLVTGEKLYVFREIIRGHRVRRVLRGLPVAPRVVEDRETIEFRHLAQRRLVVSLFGLKLTEQRAGVMMAGKLVAGDGQHAKLRRIALEIRPRPRVAIVVGDCEDVVAALVVLIDDLRGVELSVALRGVRVQVRLVLRERVPVNALVGVDHECILRQRQPCREHQAECDRQRQCCLPCVRAKRHWRCHLMLSQNVHSSSMRSLCAVRGPALDHAVGRWRSVLTTVALRTATTTSADGVTCRAEIFAPASRLQGGDPCPARPTAPSAVQPTSAADGPRKPSPRSRHRDHT